MHEFDTNHDNKISREEFKQFGGQLHVEKAFARLKVFGLTSEVLFFT